MASEPCLAVIGDERSAAAAASLGADRVYLIEPAPELAAGGRDARLQAYEQAAAECGARAVLVARSDDGAEIGPRLAARLGGVCAQDCTSLAAGPDGALTAVRPVYGGSAVARVSLPPDRTAVAIMRAGAAQAREPDPGRGAQVVELRAQIDPGRVRVRSAGRVETSGDGPGLEEAPVVIGGGRGLGGPEAFAELEELAGALGGAVGASRAACDAGWIDHSRQIGLTGRTISPDLYITFGISGASQHMAGCTAARCLVAVNTDDGAAIFRDARYGVVGDWRAVLRSFLETVRELGGG